MPAKCTTVLCGKVCPHCHKCKSHGCKCLRCGICLQLKTRSERCLKCHRCKAHHTELLPITKDFPFRHCEYKLGKDPLTTTYMTNGLRRTLGLEIECESYGPNPNYTQRDADRNVVCSFHFEHDGSVEGSKQELVLGKMSGDKYRVGVAHITSQLTANGAVAGASTGFHVHVDAADLTPFQLRRVFLAWRAMEGQIFGTLVNAKRATNIYCRPLIQKCSFVSARKLGELKTASEIMSWFYRYLYSVTLPGREHPGYKEIMAEIKSQLKKIKAHKYENAARRQALNYHSYMMRGTLEFRCMEGTVDPDTIMFWPLFCGWFVEQISTKYSCETVAGWVEGPPDLLALCEQFAAGPSARTRMPLDVVAWVRGKLQPPVTPKVSKKAPTKVVRPIPPPPPVELDPFDLNDNLFDVDEDEEGDWS